MRNFFSTSFGIGACLVALSISNTGAEGSAGAEANSGAEAAKAVVSDTTADGAVAKAVVSDPAAPGRKIFIDRKCTKCHSIDALKIAKVKSDDDEEAKDEESAGEKKVEPPDLSDAGKDKDHTVEWMSNWLLKKEKIEGHRHKKKFKGTEEELKTLSEWMVTLKYDVPKKKEKEKEK